MKGNKDYRIGSIIKHRVFGYGSVRKTKVDSIDPEIKNGRSGFCGVLLEKEADDANEIGSGVWGYDDSIVEVVKY